MHLTSPPDGPAAAPRSPLGALHRAGVVILLGLASGLPLALTGQALQAWLSVSGVDLATIGFLSLVGLPYTFKFLWAPLMDRFDLPGLGRRQGWLVLSQLLLAAGLWGLSRQDPAQGLGALPWLALGVAFLSASQDVACDAYRTDLLPPRERGLGSSLNVMGYRLAMVLSGGVTLIWTDVAQGGGWTWPEVYRFCAALMAGAAVLSALILPRLPRPQGPRPPARRDLQGFVAVLLSAAAGYLFTRHVLDPLAVAALGGGWAGRAALSPLAQRWADLLALLLGLAATLPLAAWAARRAGFDTLLNGLGSYLQQPGAVAFLGLVVLYKLGDAFAVSLMTPFLLQGVGFTSAEVGLVNKLIGLWLTVAGALLGGALMLRLGLWRALMAFGLLQMFSNLGFWWLAVAGRSAEAALLIPAFDWGVLRLTQPTPVDPGLLAVVALDNLSGGMGTAAFVAFLMSLTSQRFSATQFALLSALSAIGRVWVGPLAGVLSTAMGWPAFFVLSTAMATPALWLLWRLRAEIRALELPTG
ncbi:AmpG family muropeptide MFS transporter [Ideonella livida]|uniref:MFS transporter n=1 Tax=Ideonella livida TaxID=2707176 RepID=A0A7C9PK44_9BURK|nr:MFS transporter [Ideonella livida]NDY92974.1 MFS transporter [Ideonella livida]